MANIYRNLYVFYQDYPSGNKDIIRIDWETQFDLKNETKWPDQ